MGLLKAGIGAVGGVLADQWKEYFYCEAMDRDILVMKGRKRTGKRSSNKKGDDNIISNGSVIAVADGQCMLIVDQGKVVEVCAQPGEFVYDTSTEPSIFSGDLGESLNNTFNKIGQRFAFGGDTGKDQRVYYFNTKEIMDNRFGTPSPIPFRVVDRNIGLDIDVSVRCNGVYSYRITDPILFYTNVCGNVSEEYTREELDSQLKAEFLTALQPGFARISEMGIRPNAIPGHLMELTDAMDKILSEKWQGLRGLKIVAIGMNQVTLPEEDAEMIKQAQRMAILQNPSMAAATLAGAQAEAMKMAASNQNGAMMGFAGMNMASAQGGMNMQGLYQMGAQQNMAGMQQGMPGAQPYMAGMQQGMPGAQQNMAGMQQGMPGAQQTAPGSWQCQCGTIATGKFCPECGSPRPVVQDQWTCSCGTVNKGKFCQECGKSRPF
ncbi:MAG: SPFH domain-containing protein [Blautia sp.]|uniref:SPFH domain-containing protein n=1 Tax=Blautia ammoniilytica TaxID=2981782 RepID=A0ABT2TY24_9FIRM|nr:MULTISPECIES: SPFH domain-containing protein [Blautia]MDY3087238.1 SPFH domain-containing protein [Blautia sp.]MCU6767121.1 SPFH domain-containing protein [Blautia ammoniilytica]MEE0425435.1 SPFH domain-containing protein [Blautia sp.]NSJ26283.1 SPFH domain-containing protein [Blautia glucerasea]SCJ03655.1 Putative virion core protein (lumpy skin disease virus) [uncultured Blautia sp.]